MTSKPRIEWIDSAKGISILLVTLLHCTMLCDALDIEVSWASRLNRELAPVRMPLFFAAAGVFAGSALAGSWSGLIRRKLLLYIWLLGIWSLVRFGWFALAMPNPHDPGEGSDPARLLLTFLRPETGIWFLWSLGLFFVASKALVGIHRAGGLILALALSILSIGYVDSAAAPAITDALDPLPYRNSLHYFVFFYAAAAYPQAILSLDRSNFLRSLFAALALAATCRLALEFAGNGPDKGTLAMLLSFAGVTALFLAARFFQPVPLAGRVLTWLGQNTLPIYVAQVPVIAALAYAASAAGADRIGALGLFVPLAMVPLVVLATLALRAALQAVGAGWMYELPAFRRALARDQLTESMARQ